MDCELKVFPLPPVAGVEMEWELRVVYRGGAYIREASGCGEAAKDYLLAEALRQNTRSNTHTEAYGRTLNRR